MISFVGEAVGDAVGAAVKVIALITFFVTALFLAMRYVRRYLRLATGRNYSAQQKIDAIVEQQIREERGLGDKDHVKRDSIDARRRARPRALRA